MSSVAKRIIQLRKDKGISVIELAKLLGISRYSIHKWEAEKTTPSVEHLNKLSEIFNTDLEFIINGEVSYTQPTQQTAALDSFINQLETATSFSSITKITTDFLKSLGLAKFLYNQIFRGDTSNSPLVTILTDIRYEWQEHYVENYLDIDPTWNYAATHTAPILCDDLIKQVSKSNPRIDALFEDMRKKIAPYFVVIPIHGPCCIASFVVSAKDISKSAQNTLHMALPILTLFGNHIYEATHRIAEKKAMQHNSSLSKKELSTINHLANGLTIKEIAEKDFITVAAVNARISTAKNKMGAANCEQLVLLTASAGLLPHNFGKMRKINV